MSHLFSKFKNIFLLFSIFHAPLVLLLFASFQLFFTFFNYSTDHIHNVISTLISVVKLDVENNNIVSTLSNAVNINVEIDNVDLTLFNVVSFNVDVHNDVSTLIWHCRTSSHHITLTTTLRQRWQRFMDIEECWYKTT